MTLPGVSCLLYDPGSTRSQCSPCDIHLMLPLSSAGRPEGRDVQAAAGGGVSDHLQGCVPVPWRHHARLCCPGSHSLQPLQEMNKSAGKERWCVLKVHHLQNWLRCYRSSKACAPLCSGTASKLGNPPFGRLFAIRQGEAIGCILRQAAVRQYQGN